MVETERLGTAIAMATIRFRPETRSTSRPVTDRAVISDDFRFHPGHRTTEENGSRNPFWGSVPRRNGVRLHSQRRFAPPFTRSFRRRRTIYCRSPNTLAFGAYRAGAVRSTSSESTEIRLAYLEL